MSSLRKLPKSLMIKNLRGIEKAVKIKCYDCQNWQKRLDCKDSNCPLYPFRPWSKRTARINSAKDNQIQPLGEINE